MTTISEPKNATASSRWTPANVTQLMELYASGLSYADMCALLGRSESSIKTKLTKLRKADARRKVRFNGTRRTAETLEKARNKLPATSLLKLALADRWSRGQHREYSATDIETLKELWESGVPAGEIAARINRTVKSVHYKANNLRLPRRSTRSVPKQKIVALYVAGMTAKQIAAELNVVVKSVEDTIRTYPQISGARPKKVTDEDEEAILSFWESGCTRQCICQRFYYSSRLINEILDNTAPPNNASLDDVIEDLLKTLDVRQVGIKLNLSRIAVLRAIERNNQRGRIRKHRINGDDEIDDQIVRLKRSGFKRGVILERLGIGVGRYYKAIKSRAPELLQKPKPFTPAEDKQILDLRRQRWSVNRIGADLARNPGSIQSRLKTLVKKGLD